MKLQDIYDQLAYGELRLLQLGSGDIDNTEEGMPVESFMKMLPTVQLGLTELHKIFNLRENTITIPLVPEQVTYLLTPEDILKVLRIYGIYKEKEYEIPINKINKAESIRTTSYNTLLVPNNKEYAPWLEETTELKVVYRADHPKISKPVANAAPLATKIDLPSTHLMALLYFIASRMYNPVGLSQEFHEGNNYAMKYQQEILALQAMNYENDDDADNEGIKMFGWV
jgi:hypothetical protein